LYRAISKHGSIIEEIRETSLRLHAAGIIDKRRMREHEAFYRVNQVPQYTGKNVKELHTRLHVSQSAHYAYQRRDSARLGGRYKKTGGSSCKRLAVLNRKGLEALL